MARTTPLLKEVFSRARVHRFVLPSRGYARLSFLRVLEKKSKIADLPTVSLEAVAKSIGKSGWPPIATVMGRPSSPRELDG
jgi:hypothetical protein